MPDNEILVGEAKLCLVVGDITKQDVDAIVNAANSSLMGGGGVDGAIHRAGGPQILEECKIIRDTQGRCATGNAVITTAGMMKARYVIHTVGPVWHGGSNNEQVLLSNAYRNSLNLAVENDLSTIAFPSISTGAYGYPISQAAAVALKTVRDFLEKTTTLTEVRFVLFDQSTFTAYASALAENG